MDNQHPVLTKMNQYIKDLEAQASGLNHENLSLRIQKNDNEENIRLILLEAIAENVDVQTLANSVADVLGISLLKEVTVSIPLTIEATMLVPADFDIDDLQLTAVEVEAFNTEVEDFTVQSWDVGDIEEM